MPDMDGLQLARPISADPLLKGTPMIMLPRACSCDHGRAAQAGIGQWLTKPVRSSELYDSADAPDGRHARRTSGVESRPSARQAVAARGSRGAILVVEDNSLNQLVAAGLLSRLGYERRASSTASRPWTRWRAFDYSAVLMDCHMPVMDGFTATEEIRRREAAAAGCRSSR